jgi:hypothetical protein
MNCETVRDLIDSYVAGTLAAREAMALEQHVVSCAECAEDLAAARALRDPLRALPRQLQPPSDLWPAVRQRVGWRRTPGWGALAAAAVLLVAVSSLVTALLLNRGGSGDEPLASGSAAVQVIEAGYVEQARDLEAALEEGRDNLAPETIAIVERNLEIISNAIAESRAALEKDPANQDLRILLRTGHEQRVALLEQAVRLTREL